MPTQVVSKPLIHTFVEQNPHAGFGGQKLLGFLKRGDGHLAADAGKSLQKFFRVFLRLRASQAMPEAERERREKRVFPQESRIFYDDVACRRHARVSETSEYVILTSLDASESKPELLAAMRKLDSDPSQFQRKKAVNEWVLRLLVDSFLDQVLEAPSNFELRLPGWWIKS
ncbi:MAG TPA: hypothetical protein VNO32_34855 [Candidatus Acidoferrum sp.]|nr:hypothetical protein [Candidatus Acidoferrum sp.]